MASGGVIAAAVVVSMGAHLAAAGGGGACLVVAPPGNAEAGAVSEAERLAAASLLGQLADAARALRDIERQGVPAASPPPPSRRVAEPCPYLVLPLCDGRVHLPPGLSPALGLLDLPPPAQG